MDITYLPLQASLITASALLAAAIGLFALLRRGHWLVTLLFSASFLGMAALQAGALGIVRADSAAGARDWATYLAGVSALASWLWLCLSVVLLRPDPWQRIRDAAAYLTLALAGCVLMWVAAGTPWVIREVQGLHGRAVITLGPMGRIYLMYLVVVTMAVLMNFEQMLRIAPAAALGWLRPLCLAFLVGILSELLVVSSGLLFEGLRVSWLAASALPLFVAGSVTALALARRRLSDMSVPVARPVIYYSSVSLTVAGGFLLATAVLSKVLPVLAPEWRRAVSIGFYLLAGGGGVLLLLVPRANRAVRRFVDRNFYANRYDYRREWERVSAAIVPAARPVEVCGHIERLVCGIFDAGRAAIYLRDDRATGPDGSPADFRRLHGPGSMPAVIEACNPLVRELERSRAPVVFRELTQDLDLIPVAVENRAAIQALPAAVCAPLPAGDVLVGLLWLSPKRDGEDYSLEDVEFLGSMGRQLGAALRFARLAEQLAETRQLESLHRLSSFVLHDIKNQVSGLSLLVENARSHLGNLEFQRDAMGVVERSVEHLKELMEQVASVARPGEAQPEAVPLRALLEEAAAAAGLGVDAAGGPRFQIECHGPDRVRLDRRLVLRVLVNLLTNAREALQGPGGIALAAEMGRGRDGGRAIVFTVSDTGRGMSEEFVRDSLYRPFATTKSGGLGVGLSQCRSIVEALHGSIEVESAPGAGTRFTVRLPCPDGTGPGAGERT